MSRTTQALAAVAGAVTTLLVAAACSPAGEVPGAASSRAPSASAPADDDASLTSAPPPGDSTSSTSAGDGPPAAAAPEPLWQHDAEVLSEPSRVADTVVAYVGTDAGEGVSLIGLDPRDGSLTWSVPVDLGTIAGLGAPTVLDGAVVTVQQGEGPGAHVVALDPDDGSEVARTADAFSTYVLPSPCGLEERTACVRGVRAGESNYDYAKWQLRIEGDEITLGEPPAQDQTEVVSDELTVRLSAGTPEDPAAFGAERDGQVLWEVPATDVGLDVGGQRGRAGSVGTRNGTYVHDVFYVDLETSLQTEARVPLGEHLLLALDAETGEELWSRPGTTSCTGNAEVPEVVVTCSGEGEAILAPWPGGVAFEAEEVAMRGVERATGTTLWEYDITAEDWTALATLPWPLGGGQVVVRLDGRRELVDVRTGTILPRDSVPPGGYICADQPEWGSTSEGEPRRGDRLFFPCSLDGEPVPAAVEETVERVAHELGGLLVVTAPDSLSAYPSEG